VPNPSELAGKEKMEKKVEEAAKKFKARTRDGEVKGKWWTCTMTEEELRNMESEGFLKLGTWRVVPGSPCRALEDE
jgi:hypothetical protein